MKQMPQNSAGVEREGNLYGDFLVTCYRKHISSEHLDR